MAGNLLSHRINTLMLNANAAFPSEVKDAHSFVRDWRVSQRLKLVRSDDNLRDRDSEYPDSDPDMGGDAA